MCGSDTAQSHVGCDGRRQVPAGRQLLGRAVQAAPGSTRPPFTHTLIVLIGHTSRGLSRTQLSVCVQPPHPVSIT